MPDNLIYHRWSLSYYRIYKDAHIIILSEVEGTNASFTISVYSALCWTANDHRDQLHPFSAPIGLIAHRSGLSKRKTSDVLQKLIAINLLKIDSGRGRKVYNTYTLLIPPPQVRYRALLQPRPHPESYDAFMDICSDMGIDDRAALSFWDLQDKNNWKRKNPETDQWESLYDWPTALIKFNEKVLADIDSLD